MRIEGPGIPPGEGGQQNTYPVQDGDTLQSIGDKLGIHPEDLAKANGLPADAKLSVGMQLLLPAVQTQRPGDASGIGALPDQLEASPRDPAENLGIRFHDQMPGGVKNPGEDIGIKFHDQLPIKLDPAMVQSNDQGQMVVNNPELTRAFESLDPQENIGIRFHDQMPQLANQTPDAARGPEEIGIKFHDQIPGLQNAGGEAVNIGTLPQLNPDMFEVTDQGLLIKNEDLARAFRSILEGTQGGAASFDVLPFEKKS
jgi:LysM repeat protein